MAQAQDTVMIEDEPELKGGEQHQDDIVITEKPPEQDARPGEEPDAAEAAEDRAAEAAAKDDNEREAIRERRRQEKIDRKKRRDEAIHRDKVELEFLRKRNDELERRTSSVETHIRATQQADVDRQIAALQEDVRLADQVIAKAVAAGNGEDVVKAMRYRDEALSRANQLAQVKQQQSAQKPAAAPGIEPEVQHFATQFLKENSWYDLQGRDEDSAIVLAIDSALAREGFDPRSADYWDELRARAARRLPEKFGKATAAAEKPADRTPRGGPAMGSGREHVPTSSRKEVYISPERKQALIDAGVWDDPVLRMRYVKRYAEFDKQNRV